MERGDLGHGEILWQEVCKIWIDSVWWFRHNVAWRQEDGLNAPLDSKAFALLEWTLVRRLRFHTPAGQAAMKRPVGAQETRSLASDPRLLTHGVLLIKSFNLAGLRLQWGLVLLP